MESKKHPTPKVIKLGGDLAALALKLSEKITQMTGNDMKYESRKGEELLTNAEIGQRKKHITVIRMLRKVQPKPKS